jgi:Kef-type K+ transport system membrane component KefB
MVNVTVAAGGSILSGANPLADPLSQFLLQAIVILTVCRLVAIPLSYMRQPRGRFPFLPYSFLVISEVIGGILLGKSALSRIPWFQQTVFPASSLETLSTIAQLGLILFLFLVGMEIDPKSMVQNFKLSASVSMAGIAFPFVLSIGVSKLMYDNFMYDNLAVGESPKPFTAFLVFTGVAMSITAFPVLARMLTERKLLRVQVGKVTLSAAALDDAFAWILLILSVALGILHFIHFNPSQPIVQLYRCALCILNHSCLWYLPLLCCPTCPCQIGISTI